MTFPSALDPYLAPSLSAVWQVRTVRWMCEVADQVEEPDEVVEEWFGEAVERDHPYLVHAELLWRRIAPMGATAREQLRLEAARWLAAID